jgi:enamine deaminase RidA (YjgF/YER057c/UK114 family)
MGADAALDRLGIELPAPPTALASYVPVRVQGDLAHVSGQVPWDDRGELMYPGKVGATVTVDQAREGARRCALQALAALRAELRSLDRVTGVVQVWAWIASDPLFTEQPKVANAASDLLVEVFGETGRHARAAVGVPVLPLNASVEVAVVASIS